MNRNAVAIASSVLFVVLAAIVVLTPAPYVTWRPGTPVDVLGQTDNGPIIDVTGVETHETSGALLMTLVSTSKASSTVSLPEALAVYLQAGSDAMPRELIYPPGKSEEEISQEAVASMDTSRDNAIVAALRAAGISVTERPMVASVILSGPAGEALAPGDLIVAVDGDAVATPDEVAQAISRATVGETVTFEVLRDRQVQMVPVTVESSSQNTSRPFVGISLTIGHEYAPDVTYHLSDEIVGPSAGLTFALGIYDKLTTGQLLGDLTVAATGEIDPSGQVRSIGGVQQKLHGAESSGATVFLIPRDNCPGLEGVATDLRVVPVATLRDAIAALQYIQEGNESEVATCD